MRATRAFLKTVDDWPLSGAAASFLSQSEFGHLIEGEIVASASGETMAIFDPATGLEFARCASGGAEDVDRAVRSARQAFDDGRWRNLDAQEKERRLHRLSVLLQQSRPLLMDLDVIDGGVVRAYSEFIVQFGIDTVDYYAGWPTKLQGRMPASPPDVVVQEVREPVGVCAVISPWNGPSAAPCAIVPALACGNSVVLKPAEQTPLTALVVAKLCLEAGIPPGVVNVVQGRGEVVGAALVEHPLVDAISFTGSGETGRRIQAAAAPTLKRLSMELGGKSPQIVFDDADLDAAATAVAGAAWGHSGQVCTAGTRVLIQRGIHDELVAEMVARSRNIKIGSGFRPDTQMGPLISQEQLDRVNRYVALGKAQGAQVALGGEQHGSTGYFHKPTIFTGVDNRMTIAREEIFGPVMSVIPFDTEEEALAIANDTEFGLAAGVWTRDLSRAHRASRAIRAGTVWINTYQRVNPAIPYGGVKQSGYGRSLGHESLEHYTQIKTVWIKIA
ncbi:acyl-CoA reductase-like NAD-dependent aldehyde dehydrogenase [Caulobacter ginsengisoli]|uniref:Acyl-CoA reductase-like NAD-dependent aldehyde dehydrogenase n=1 Tax=Caulobacter ginsengisoli TaxID=400775 RepID=A0ABU0J0R3_9CAUL|nr:aldehyde dehydrogenase family protein [Caulobacter ginsengisoli]MDQ0466889.1 acyl-CoA reductase-like NAD-dependent aldehyde dehydrogenase [Caulobacter ginsengisoli]